MVFGINLTPLLSNIAKSLLYLFIIKEFMKRFRYASVVVVLLVGFVFFTSQDVQAQCAMCSLTAENATQNGNTQGKGLNNGILFLLAMPYLIVGLMGFLWYKRYRSKKNIQVPETPINLN